HTAHSFFFFPTPPARPPRPSLFPYTTLFRSQTLLAELNHVISHRRNEPYLGRFRLKFIELDAVLADYDRWTRIFEDTLYDPGPADRKSTRLNSSHDQISYAVFCLKKKKTIPQ